MNKNKVSIGSWITLNHYSIVEIMADAGFDWLCIDMEHSVIDYYDAQQLIATIQSKGLTSFVRVGENNQRIIKRVLDAGADGIIIPLINSKEDAQKAVDAVKYPPVGKRGVGLARAQKYGFGFDKYIEKHKTIKIIAQIEHITAIDNLREIIEVEGVDGTIIGPYDLSASMGKPGKFDDDDVKQALIRYKEITKKYNKSVGFHVIQPDYKLVLEKVNEGYNFIAFSLDTIFLGDICRNELKKLHKELEIK